MSVFGVIFLLLFAAPLWLLWRIVRCLEWLVACLGGFSQKAIERWHELDEEYRQRQQSKQGNPRAV